jgi:TolB protein
MRARKFLLKFISLALLLFAVVSGQVHSSAQEPTGAMLAVVGNDGNISIYDANGKNPFPLTTDAARGEQLYSWPTWSNDGRLAFFGVNQSASLDVLVADQVKPGASYASAYSSTDEVFTYAYWSPADCLTGHCRDLALLFTPAEQNSGLALRLIRDNNGAFTNKEVGRSAPFYYSFSPDASQMLWYQSGRQLSIYDVQSNQIVKTLDDIPGQFQAPMWSPIDDRLLIGTVGDDAETTNLVVAQATKRQVLLRNLEAPVSFAWSPDATKVASVAAFDKLVVTDVAGKTVAEGTQSNVVAHFWSPQSDRVAYLVVVRSAPDMQARVRNNGHRAAEQATGGLVWYVLDVNTGKSTSLSTFLPTRDMVYLLNFFDQFARSHSLWSSDGKYLTYGATDSLGQSIVMLVDTRTGSTSRVGSGSIGIWSWR